MNKKTMITLISVGGGMAAVVLSGLLIWNSRQCKTARAVKRASTVLYRVGTAMQDLSGM